MLGAHNRSIRPESFGLDRASRKALQQAEHIKVYLACGPELADKFGNVEG
jgi:hypothetical protein